MVDPKVHAAEEILRHDSIVLPEGDIKPKVRNPQKRKTKYDVPILHH